MDTEKREKKKNVAMTLRCDVQEEREKKEFKMADTKNLYTNGVLLGTYSTDEKFKKLQ